MLTGERWLVVALRYQIKFRFEQRRRRLEPGIRCRRRKGKFLAFDVRRRLDRTIGRHNDFHFVTESTILAGHDGEGYESCAIYCDLIGAGIQTPDMHPPGAHRFDLCCVRLHRKNTTLLPVTFSMCLMKPSQTLV